MPMSHRRASSVPDQDSRSPGPPRRRSRRGRGQALAEFAIVIPVFLLVLSGILDFGFALYTRMSVINVAREGARAAVLATDMSTIPTVVFGRVQSAAAQAGLSTDSLDVPDPKCIQMNPKTSSPCNWSVHSLSNTSGAESGDSVSVTVNYPYKSFFPLLFGTTFNLSATVQMVIE